MNAKRAPLTADRIVDAAVAVADRGGLAAVSMRRVGSELGVEAMSLYHHVAGKEALTNLLADAVFAKVELPKLDDPWRVGITRRSVSARAVFARHPWALSLVDTQAAPGPAVLQSYDRVFGCLRRGGFSLALASHAFAVVDSYVYGFALTERNLPFDSAGSGAVDYMESMVDVLAELPYLAEFATAALAESTYTFGGEFEYGLDVILDELERRLEQESAD